MKVCIIGASGKLGRYMVQHALDRGHEVVGVCRERSVSKLEGFRGRMTIIPGATNNRQVIQQAVAGCDGVLTVLVPWGVQHYSSGTAQAVLDYAQPNARLIFSCGWHITATVWTSIPARSRSPSRPAHGSASCCAPWKLMTRWKPAGVCSPAQPAGRSCAAAILRKVKARACRCGAGISVIRFSRAIAPVAWTSPFSWWTRLRTTR